MTTLRPPSAPRTPPWPWPICPIFRRPTPILSETGTPCCRGRVSAAPVWPLCSLHHQYAGLRALLGVPGLRCGAFMEWGGGTWSGCQRRWNFRGVVLRPALWDVLAGDTDALLFKPPNVPPASPFHPKHQIPELQDPSTQSPGLTFTEHPLCARHLTCRIS